MLTLAASIFISLMTVTSDVDTTEVYHKTVELDPITVIGKREPIRLSKTVNSVIKLTPEIIQSQSNDNILGYLNNSNSSLSISSVSANGYGLGPNGQGKLLIRGLGFAPNRGSLVLIDGRPDIAGLFGHPLPDTYRKAGLYSAELVKGGASTLYGSNAVAGVLDLHSFYRPDHDRYFNVELSGGSFDTYNSTLQYSQKVKKMILSGWYEYLESDNHRENNEYLNRSGGFRVQLNEIKNYNIFIAGRYTSFDFADAGPTYNLLRTTGDIQRVGTTLGIDKKTQGVSFSLRLYNSYGEHAFSDGFSSIDRNNGLDMFARLNNFVLDDLNISGGLSYNVLGGSAHSPARFPFPPFAPIITEGNFSESEYAVHLQTDYDISENMNFTLGGRYVDHERYDGQFVYQSGLVISPEKIGSIKLSVGSAYRNPTISELVLLPPGNDNLKPEEGTFYEVGYFKTIADRFSIEMALFYREGENLIESKANPAPPPMVLNQNSGRYYHNGYEAALKYLYNNKQYALYYTHLNQESYNLSVPEDKFVLNGELIKSKMLDVSFEVVTAFNTASDSLGYHVILDDYFVVNLSNRYRVSPQAELNLSIDNLFDADYEVVHGYPMPGITFRAGFAFRIY